MPSVAATILRASREAARAARSAASAASRCAAAAAAAAKARSGSGGAPASDPLVRSSSSSVAASAAQGRLSLGSVHSPIAAPPPSGSGPSDGSGSTTTTLRPPNRSPIIAAPPSWSSSSPSYGSGSTISTPPPFEFDDMSDPMPAKPRAEFVAEEKDLESDEAQWALYERWCNAFNQARDRDEMAQRFSKFKDTVLRVQQNKKAGLPYMLVINQFADRKAHRSIPL